MIGDLALGDCHYRSDDCGFPEKCSCVKYEAQQKAEQELGDLVRIYSEKPKLETMFELQMNLTKKFYPEVESLSPEQRAKELKENVSYMLSELAETLHSLPFKGWKKYPQYDESNLFTTQGEIVDMFCFIVQMGIISGMTAEDLFKRYIEKNTENMIRQELGY